MKYEVHPTTEGGYAVVNSERGITRCEFSDEREAVKLAAELNAQDQEQAKDVMVKVCGVNLRRRTKIGPKGGAHVIYQAVSASPDWGYWYDSAYQAVLSSNESDRVVSA